MGGLRRRGEEAGRLRRWAAPFVTAAHPAALVLCLATAALPLAPARAQQQPLAHPGGSEGVDGARRAAREALERWDVAAARAALAALQPGGDPVDAVLAARVALHSSDYAGALRAIDALPRDAADAEPLASLRRLAAASLAMDQGLATVESEHFLVRYDPERDWVLAEQALAALEAGYRAAGEWLDERVAGKVRVEIAPETAAFERVTGLTKQQIETAGAVGVTVLNKIVILSPRLLLRGYRWRDVLNHEYLHYLLVRAAANGVPIWLQEGVARYGESRWRSGGEVLDELDRALLARARADGRLIPLASLAPGITLLPSAAAVRLAFAECAFAVDQILAGRGTAGLRALIRELGRERADDQGDAALRAVLGLSLEAFEQSWRAAIEGRGFAQIPGAIVPAHRLAGAGAAEDADLAEWQPLAAQNHLRLGDLLRARGSHRAALVEYERASAAAPGSPFARVKVARALLAGGRAKEAAAAARDAVRLGAEEYPAAFLALAAAEAALGDDAVAAAAIEASLEVNPFDPFAWRELARTLRRVGREEQAQRAAVTALRLGPEDEGFMRSVTDK